VSYLEGFVQALGFNVSVPWLGDNDHDRWRVAVR
jgi:hypothetical protein